MALSNDNTLAERMIALRSHGITNNRDKMKFRSADEIWSYQQIDLGYNYRMTDIQAALGLSQLGRIDDYVNRRHEIVQAYGEALSGLPIILPWQSPDTRSSYYLYPIRIRESQSNKTQQQVYDALLNAKIAINLHYIPVYRQPYYEDLGFEAGYCPEAELYHKESISLPIFPKLSAEQISNVVSVLVDILKYDNK
jgi:dTDP-4-amino-4,6-dideoxygalactose transaminase